MSSLHPEALRRAQEKANKAAENACAAGATGSEITDAMIEAALESYLSHPAVGRALAAKIERLWDKPADWELANVLRAIGAAE